MCRSDATRHVDEVPPHKYHPSINAQHNCGHKFINAIESHHSNRKEDRIFRIHCCQMNSAFSSFLTVPLLFCLFFVVRCFAQYCCRLTFRGFCLCFRVLQPLQTVQERNPLHKVGGQRREEREREMR
jgi:hypothetical protein